MKRRLWLLVPVFAMTLLLSACGEKSKEDVVQGLNEKIEEMKGYKAKAEMTLKVGDEPQTYEIEIWHRAPDHYRVHLKNDKKEQSQMILRNDDGVYVLTPALNKSYRFQSDWPANGSQPYLYASLVKDILEDKASVFRGAKDIFVFETKTRYQNNKMVPIQEITFHKKSLAPKLVKVMDTNRNQVIAVDFSAFEFNPKFDDDSFEVKKNMTGAQLVVPVDAGERTEDFIIKYPTAELPDVQLVEKEEIDTGNGTRVVLTYGGEKSFTLFQEKAEVIPTMMMETEADGKMADLGFAIGEITENSLSWTYNGVDYLLASQDLTEDEMMTIARSVQGTGVK